MPTLLLQNYSIYYSFINIKIYIRNNSKDNVIILDYFEKFYTSKIEGKIIKNTKT